MMKYFTVIFHFTAFTGRKRDRKKIRNNAFYEFILKFICRGIERNAAHCWLLDKHIQFNTFS